MLQSFLKEPLIPERLSLRRVICSGEELSSELQKQYFDCLGADLFNLYGPTEAAVDVTAWRCRKDDQSNVVPIGRPIANTEIYILDESLSPVPVGGIGELHIGGVGLADGYWGRTALTAEKFIPNPFSDAPGSRLYKTGDVARYLAEGEIVYLGRRDQQVKIRGVRVELREIEAAISEISEVEANVVMARKDRPGDERLVAYVVSRSPGLVEPEKLRNHLKSRLPAQMVPSHFILLESFPLSANGKLDRTALPAPSGLSDGVAVKFIPPTDELEIRIAEVWKEILKIDRIGVNHNFFDLGGHSLLLIEVAEILSKSLGRTISVIELFQYPTIASLTARLEGLAQEPVRSASQQDAQRKAIAERNLRRRERVRQSSL
jgi:acyl carrier protein